jgi:hypothetical protein
MEANAIETGVVVGLKLSAGAYGHAMAVRRGNEKPSEGVPENASVYGFPHTTAGRMRLPRWSASGVRRVGPALSL